MTPRSQPKTESPWTSLVARILLVASALVVLAWIGRATASVPARAGPAPRVDADGVRGAEPPDAGAPMPSPSAGTAGLPAPRPPPLASASSRATPEDPVYVNHASAEELRRLPGVGPKRAEAIVALRARLGRFQRVEDLLRVKGIGRATLRKWRPLVRIDTPVDGGAPVTAARGP